MSSAPKAPTASSQDRTESVLIGVGIIAFAWTLMVLQRRWAYNFPLIAHDRYFWATMFLVFLGTTVATEAAWRFALRRSTGYAPVLGFVVTVGAYHVFYPIANGGLDRSTAEQHIYVIEKRSCFPNEGLATLWLRPVATTDSSAITLDVPRDYCREASDGQELLLEVKRGFLGTPWVANYTVMQHNVENPDQPD